MIEELQGLLTQLGEKKYLADYIFAFIHFQNVNLPEQITPLSKSFREKLSDLGYYISQLKIVQKLVGTDGTVKYLFELSDGSQIQTVLLFDGSRKTLCVSTQIGCAMGCSFCATATLGLIRNLSAAEIADQLNAVVRDGYKMTNVVYMGMGEPMQNYGAVLKAVRILNHRKGRNLGVRHQTLSTCGIVPAINRLAEEDIRPRLAISLNAATDSIRTKLMPINKKYPIAALLKAVRLYQLRTGQRVTFEYVLIAGVNDSADHAQSLAKLLRNFNCNVNLIEFNPHQGCKLAAANLPTITDFGKIMEDAGIKNSIRLKKGQKIKAACGQLGA